MKFISETLTENYAKQICNWKYEGEYSIYNYPKWDKIFSENWGITIEQTRENEFSAIVDKCTNLYGYIRILDKNDYLLIGLGLKPSLCGQGLGTILMEILKQQCNIRYGNKKIVLEVRSFNKRAITCYKKAGFKAVDTYKKETPMGYGEFIKMEFTDQI
ncbi:GNAT family N-acetyltransferase [Clostridium bowmanii]|uniref:GNAT family N-acetyltransferase n=1 Tax=Clostridium bowmanii TaxID=132925 RepID=UPI001C0CC7C9|nr:GNAT family N-acetyltransferase [Clostridium bowmanii]MBU3191853.1 GNAT family N-acetyltransferase [Clostridium bowmanii]MCA1076157.1 GNAT family N-acetyltransferase [Clostridium bowmanii]